MNASPPKTLTTTATGEPQKIEHEIRLRAHQLHVARGREDGHEVEDWLRAEEELTRKKFRTATA
jgi:hypothetical protein